MSGNYFLFTLHESEDDFRIAGAVLAQDTDELVSIVGGQYIPVEGQPPESATNPDDLSLHGKIRFAPDLFRRLTEEELATMALDYSPGPFYSPAPGFVVWARPGEQGREFILRKHFIC